MGKDLGTNYIKFFFRRYELLWLPLAASCTDKVLAPPADVHWVWFVHMLAPEYYEKDCKNIVGSMVDHKLFKMKVYYFLFYFDSNRSFSFISIVTV